MAGHVPIKDKLTLTRGADFMHEVGPSVSDPDLPSGTSARIEITETNDTDAEIVDTWDAVFVDSRIVRFRVESEVCDLIPARFCWRLMVRYPDTPDIDHCWYYGTVERKQ